MLYWKLFKDLRLWFLHADRKLLEACVGLETMVLVPNLTTSTHNLTSSLVVQDIEEWTTYPSRLAGSLGVASLQTACIW